MNKNIVLTVSEEKWTYCLSREELVEIEYDKKAVNPQFPQKRIKVQCGLENS